MDTAVAGQPYSEQLLAQLKELLEVYQRHLDLYVKGFTVAPAILCVASAFLYLEVGTTMLGLLLSMFAAFVALMANLVSRIARRWVENFRTQVDGITKPLGMPPVLFEEARTMTRGLAWAWGIFALLAAANTVRVWYVLG